MPLITDEWISSLYTRLSAMDIQLDPNPLELGPSVLNAKHSELRTALSNLEAVSLEIMHNLHMYTRELTNQKLNYSLEQTRLMASDPQVKVGRSQAEREALAATKLTKHIIQINELQLAVQDLESADKVVKGKRNDLKNLQATLKDQFRLCQEQIALGGRWGRSLASPSSYNPTRSFINPLNQGDDEEDSVGVLETNEDLKSMFDSFIDEVSTNKSPLVERRPLMPMPQPEPVVVTKPEPVVEQEPEVAIVSDLNTLFSLAGQKAPKPLEGKVYSDKKDIEDFLSEKPDLSQDVRVNGIEEDLSDLFDFNLK